MVVTCHCQGSWLMLNQCNQNQCNLYTVGWSTCINNAAKIFYEFNIIACKFSDSDIILICSRDWVSTILVQQCHLCQYTMYTACQNLYQSLPAYIFPIFCYSLFFICLCYGYKRSAWSLHSSIQFWCIRVPIVHISFLMFEKSYTISRIK